MLGPLILTVVGYGLALGPVLAGLPDLPGWLPVGVLAAAAVWGLVAVRRRRERPRHIGRVVAVVAQVGILVMHAGWYYGLASYEPPATAPRFGDLAPPVQAVRVRDGARFDLRAQRGQRSVLVFFRGAW